MGTWLNVRLRQLGWSFGPHRSFRNAPSRRLRTITIVAVICSLVGTMAFGAATSAIAAQATPTEISQLPGVQSGVARSWQIPFSWSTPESSDEPQVGYLAASIIQFDTEAHAEESFGIVVAGVQETPVDEATPDVHFFVSADFGGELGDERVALQPADASWAPISALIVREGSLIYLVVGTAMQGDPSATIVALTETTLTRPAGSGSASLVADGTSSGGLWDKFPPASDPTVASLTVVSDTDPLTNEDAS